MNLYTLKQLQQEFRVSWDDSKRIIAENNVAPAVTVGKRALYDDKAREVFRQERQARQARKNDPEYQKERMRKVHAARDAFFAKRRAEAPNDRAPGWAPPVDLAEKLDRLQVTMDMVLEVLTRPQLESTDD